MARRPVSGGEEEMTPDAPDFASVVRLEGVQKYFGAVHALRDIDLAIGRNEIVGLIGDNGAGKSTLIKVLTGVYAPTEGRIFVRDREIQPHEYSVRMAHDLSIETVYQDKSLAEKQPLWRNFFVGRQIANRFGFIDIKREKEIAQQILIDVIGFRGVGITVDSTVANLSGGERQGIAIGRAMHYNADLIVLDEPTAALGVAEVRKVVDFVRRIKSSGRACIYIEHNLAHVHEVADRLVVLDRGRVVAEISPKEMNVAELTEYLIDLQHKT
jgi:simple sugar transport system ATP-binding protein